MSPQSEKARLATVLSRMRLHKIAYFFYKGSRSLVRAAGVAKPARKLLGPVAGRLVFNRSANAGRPLVIQGHKMFLAPEGRYPSPDMVVDRYERGTTELFRHLLQPSMVVVDVGAHVGYFSLLAAELVGTTGTVYAFEPEPGNYGLLRQNIELNSYSNIQAVEKAVSNKSETTQLFLGALDSGSHSIYGTAARGAKGDVRVTTTTLDAFLEAEGWPKVNLVKIDVEGAELAILEGMERLIQKNPALKLIIEFCPHLLQSAGAKPADLLNKLASMGFQVQVIDDQKGPVPLEAADSDSITSKLLKQESYINLVCSRK